MQKPIFQVGMQYKRKVNECRLLLNIPSYCTWQQFDVNFHLSQTFPLYLKVLRISFVLMLCT